MSYKIQQPSAADRRVAMESFDTLRETVAQLKADSIPEIEIEETGERVKIPLSALKLLVEVLGRMKQGKPFSLMPVASEMTTQAAAEYLNCSRPHVVKLLEEGEIPYTKVGRHRRIRLEDLKKFSADQKAKTKAKIIEMMDDAEDMGLYD